MSFHFGMQGLENMAYHVKPKISGLDTKQSVKLLSTIVVCTGYVCTWTIIQHILQTSQRHSIHYPRKRLPKSALCDPDNQDSCKQTHALNVQFHLLHLTLYFKENFEANSFAVGHDT